MIHHMYVLLLAMNFYITNTRLLRWRGIEESGQVYSPRTGHVVVAWGGTFYVSFSYDIRTKRILAYSI